MILSFLGFFKKTPVILGTVAIGAISIGMYLYVSNLKSTISDLQNQNSTLVTINQVQNGTIESLTKRLANTQVELKNLGENFLKYERETEETIKRLGAKKIRKQLNENPTIAQDSANKELNGLFERINEITSQSHKKMNMETDSE